MDYCNLFTAAANAVNDKMISNPGLEALWADERRYRAAKGLETRDLDAQLAQRASPVANNDSIILNRSFLLVSSERTSAQ